ncbi:GNAT family N-acetyltransferase [Massilia violaceinigra]|uniref:GNAT family N-acetyltransferase n=1 Tax=Massilia violaceinigra TaxID=2045208 RepID=A0ABY4AG68_9BURK|nr:GNAT family N-acetyltransferase [Massilia violaceinigra]
MDIRAATMADLESLAALDTVAVCDPGRRVQIRQWIESGTCHVAHTGDSVGAYGVLAYHFFGNGFIEMVMVGDAFRRQGLGMALVRYFQACCTTPKLFASTNLSNQRMQELLKAAGFRTSGLIDNLDDNDPEIVFFSRSGVGDRCGIAHENT